MAKYSLGTDDIAGLRWMALNTAKEVLSRGDAPATVVDVIAGAQAIESYIIDQVTRDQIASDAATGARKVMPETVTVN